MSRLYTDTHRTLQDEFGTRGLADAVEQGVVVTTISDGDAAFIESRDMFFLSTVNESGQPTVSYKGGDPGFVKVLNPTTLVFPSYDGNGMFLSMGNLAANPNIGLLFIDFESPNRKRLQGTATLERIHPMKELYPEADLIVELTLSEMWLNCPRYIHRYEKVDAAVHIPRPGMETPLAAWKRIDAFQPLISEADQARAANAGLITTEDYLDS